MRARGISCDLNINTAACCASRSAGPAISRWADLMSRIFTVSLLLAYASAPGIAGETATCSHDEAIAAESSIGGLASWNALHESFTRFAKCDDAAIGEAYSDLVMRLLADRWSELPELAKLGVHDAPFELFVLKHIDETWTDSKFALVMANAKTKCPAGAQTICQRIVERGRQVDAESESVK